MKSKLILCLLMICLLVSSLGIVSAFNLEHIDRYENGTIRRTYFVRWDNKSFDDPVRVDVSFYQSTPELNAMGVNSSWQRVVNDAIKDINNMDNNSGSRANFAFINEFRESDVTMTAHPFNPAVDSELDGTWLAVTRDPDSTYYKENRTYVCNHPVIAINTNGNYFWGIPGIKGVSFDLESTIVHELGHAAGLYHHTGPNSAMRVPLAYEGEHRRWGADDVDGLIAIYGERRETPNEETPNEETPRNIPERLKDIKESVIIKDSVVIRENISGVETVTVQEQTRIKTVSVVLEGIVGYITGFDRWVNRDRW